MDAAVNPRMHSHLGGLRLGNGKFAVFIIVCAVAAIFIRGQSPYGLTTQILSTGLLLAIPATAIFCLLKQGQIDLSYMFVSGAVFVSCKNLFTNYNWRPTPLLTLTIATAVGCTVGVLLVFGVKFLRLPVMILTLVVGVVGIALSSMGYGMLPLFFQTNFLTWGAASYGCVLVALAFLRLDSRSAISRLGAALVFSGGCWGLFTGLTALRIEAFDYSSSTISTLLPPLAAASLALALGKGHVFPLVGAFVIAALQTFCQYRGLPRVALEACYGAVTLVSLMIARKSIGGSPSIGAPHETEVSTERRVTKPQLPSEIRSDSNHADDVTRRLLAASLLFPSFRRHVLGRSLHSPRSLPLERGVDSSLVVAFCDYLKTRDFRWNAAALGVALLAGGFFQIHASAGLLILSIIPAIYLRRAFEERRWLERHLKPGRFQRGEFIRAFDLEIIMEKKKSFAAPDQANVLIFANREDAFGWAGDIIMEVSFSVDLGRAKGNTQRCPVDETITAEGVLDAIRSELRSIRVGDGASKTYLLVQGHDVKNISFLLPDKYSRPCQLIEPAVLDNIATTQPRFARKYSAFEVDWCDGDVRAFIFIRTHIQNEHLHVDLIHTVLPPLDPSLSTFETEKDFSGAEVGKFVSSQMTIGAGYVLTGPLSAVAGVFERTLEPFIEKRSKKAVKEEIDRGIFNYGCAGSVRALYGREERRKLFQDNDVQAGSKMFFKFAAESIIRYLDHHNVDTSELKEGQSQVLNYGILVNGGNVAAGALAVGPAAQASNQNPQRTRPGKAMQRT